MAAGANEETVKFKVELDPQGFRSQLMQMKQEIGLTLNAAGGSFGQTVDAAGIGFNSLQRDVGAFAGAAGAAKAAGSGIADLATRASLAALPLGMGEVAGQFGGSAGFVAGGVPGMLVGGIAGYMAGSAAGEGIMGPGVTRYAAQQAIEANGGRYGISASSEVMQGISQIGAANQMSGTDTLSVLSSGLRTGAFGQVSGAGDFKQKFGQLMAGAREISQDLNTELSESVAVISSLQNSGFSSIRSAMGAMRMARVTSGLTGLSMQESLGLAQAGAALGMSQGFGAETGSRFLQSNFESVTLAMRNKTLDMEAVSRMGGRQGAAATMAAGQMRYLQSPMGSAMMMASYDPNTGQLDPNRSFVEPGMAYSQAMNNVFSSANPMRAIAEFMGNKSDLAQQMSPEEVALGQTMQAMTMARHIDPKGPVTRDFLASVMQLQGMTPETARATVATSTDPSIFSDRQQEILKQQAAQAQRAAPMVGGHRWFSGADGPLDAMRKGMESLYTEGRARDVPFIGGYLEDMVSASGFGGATIETGVGALSNMAQKVLGSAGVTFGNFRRNWLGEKAPRPVITADALRNSVSNDAARDMAGGVEALSVTRMHDMDTKANASIDAIFREAFKDGGKGEIVREKFRSNLGAIIEAGKIGGTGTETFRKLVDSATEGMSESQKNAFRTAATSAMGDPTLKAQYAMQTSAVRSDAGMNFLRSRVPGGEESYSMIAGSKEAGTEEGFRNTLTDLLNNGRGTGPLSLLQADHKRILSIPASPGGDIALDDILRDSAQFQGMHRDSLIQFAAADKDSVKGGEKTLSKVELAAYEASVVSAHAVKAGMGAVAFGGGSPGQSELYSRLNRLISVSTRLSEAIEQRLPAITGAGR